MLREVAKLEKIEIWSNNPEITMLEIVIFATLVSNGKHMGGDDGNQLILVAIYTCCKASTTNDLHLLLCRSTTNWTIVKPFSEDELAMTQLYCVQIW